MLYFEINKPITDIFDKMNDNESFVLMQMCAEAEHPFQAANTCGIPSVHRTTIACPELALLTQP